VEYLGAWLLGLVPLSLLYIGTAATRGTGDAKTSASMLLLAALLNIAFDPIFIFGLGPIPALGVHGAGWSAALSSTVTGAATLRHMVKRRETYLDTQRWSSTDALTRSWRAILSIGGPSAFSFVATPIGWALVTRLVSTFGAAAVAGYAIGDRFQRFFVISALALSSALGPVVAQNWGAGRAERVVIALSVSRRLTTIAGFAVWIVLAVSAPLLSGLLSQDPAVRSATEAFFFIVPAGFAGMGVVRMSGAALNALDRALLGTVLEALRTVGSTVPAAWICGQLFGLHGLFVGLALGNLLLVPLAVIATSRVIPRAIPAVAR
jgi:Na+-driven multidrug efflux pump